MNKSIYYKHKAEVIKLVVGYREGSGKKYLAEKNSELDSLLETKKNPSDDS